MREEDPISKENSGRLKSSSIIIDFPLSIVGIKIELVVATRVIMIVLCVMAPIGTMTTYNKGAWADVGTSITNKED